MTETRKWSDALDQALRTFFQSATGIFLAVLASSQLGFIPSTDALKAAAIAAAWGGFVAVLSFLQNAAENLRFFPALGRDVPPAGPAGDA